VDFLKHWRGRRVLVTGGSGFIGAHVLRLGASAGVEVHSVSRSIGIPEAENHQADLLDRDAILKIVRTIRPDGIIHLAAAGVAGPATDDLIEKNGVMTDNLLSAGCLTAVTQVVIAGSGIEYGNLDRPAVEDDPLEPVTAYAKSKAAASERAARFATETPITVLRVFSVYGPGEREPRLTPYLINRARSRQPAELTACEQIRDYAYVEEVAEAFWRALVLEHQPSSLRVFNLGTGRPIRLKELVLTLAGLLAAEGHDADLRIGERSYRGDEPMSYTPAIDRMKEALSWSPSLSLRDGLGRTLASTRLAAKNG
jgi:nucleoside-diphosphate-sugar epimerase